MTRCQRWTERRASYRPAGEVINTREHEVVEMSDDARPKGFIVEHHYSGTYPAARWRFGLFRGERLVGVAVFSHPSNDKVLTSVFPGSARDSVELGRFVLLDEVPGNGETWFLARAFALLRREGLRGVVSFSDPVARADNAGRVVAPGHIGTIYQAHNASYLGRATPRTLHLLPNGTVFSARAQQKVRRREQGWRYAVEQLIAAGLAPPSGEIGAWLRGAVAQLRRVRHPGNHRYAWSFARRERLASLPYPKTLEAA